MFFKRRKRKDSQLKITKRISRIRTKLMRINYQSPELVDYKGQYFIGSFDTDYGIRNIAVGFDNSIYYLTNEQLKQGYIQNLDFKNNCIFGITTKDKLQIFPKNLSLTSLEMDLALLEAEETINVSYNNCVKFTQNVEQALIYFGEVED